MSREKKIITYACMIICFLLVFIYCLSPFAVGLNHGYNNTSFENALGIKGAGDGFFYTGYTIVDSGYAVGGSMYKLLKPLVSLAGLFSNYLDIRLLSFIYAFLLIISVYYLNKYINFNNNTANIIFAALTVFAAFDLSYLLYLNTLYAEGMFYVLFLYAVSLYIKIISSDKLQIPSTIIFVITALIICTLKSFMILMVIPFVIMTGYLIFKRKSLVYRVITCTLSLILIIYPFFEINNFVQNDNDKYNSVFYGVLYDNKAPAKALEKLNIDTKYESLAGTNHYSKTKYDINSSEFKNEVTDRITVVNNLKYYISNPAEYVKQYKYVGWNALETYPKYVGNYSSKSGKGAEQLAGGFKLFNVIKEKFIPKSLWFLYIIPALLIAILIAYRKLLNKGYVALGISIAVMDVILFNAPMITSGLVDISRTMAMFNITFDSSLVMIIGCMLYVSIKRKQEFKDKYGLTQ